MDVLTAALVRRVRRPPTWLAAVLQGEALDEARASAAFGAAAYDVGREPVVLDESEARDAVTAGVPWAATGACRIDDLARVVLARSLARRAEDPTSVLMSLFKRGDNHERAAVLRTLPLVDAPDRVVAVATEGCRTNVKTVFEALACENPYPARHLPDAAFCQMVLKAIFVGTPIARVAHLDTRMTPELQRMAAGYASERRAAGRPVPDDVTTLLAMNHAERHDTTKGASV